MAKVKVDDDMVKSLVETAARAVVTATVTFAAGLILKRMFDKSVAAVKDRTAQKAKHHPARPAGRPATYRQPAK